MKSNPRFILSRSKAIEQFNVVSRLADFVSYSFKTNSYVAKILDEETDSHFSVHAMHGVEALQDASRIWFFAQAWTEDELDEIVSAGVNRFVVDNENDLKVLLDYVDAKSVSIELLLRMRLKEHTIHTGKHFVYGMYSNRVVSLLKELSGNDHISKLGIHFHRKTQNVSEWSLKYELEQILDADVLKLIDYVNIGGGIPSTYKNFRADVLDSIFAKIADLRQWLNSFGIKMIVEPGRFIAAPSAKLEVEIMNIYDNNIIVNSSIFAGAMDTYIAHIRLEVENELPDGAGQAYTIKGRTPDSPDIFRYKVCLDNPSVGDKIIFLNAGAYTYSTDFCGLKKPDVVVVD
jgi:ornithine decarboxylase